MKSVTYSNKMMPPPPENKARHFWTEERTDANPLQHCWCGAALEVNYIRDGMTMDEAVDMMGRELHHFKVMHMACAMPNNHEKEKEILHDDTTNNKTRFKKESTDTENQRDLHH